MNIEKERELFLHELAGHGYEFYNKTWIHGLGDVGNRFDDDQLNMVWEMWLASRNRDGYALVPVDTLEECLSWASVAMWDSPSEERDIEITHHTKIIEATIGGVDE